MISPDQTAALVMDNIPMMMRILRSKFREKYAGDLSVVQFRTLAFVNDQQGASLSEAAGHIGLGLPSMSKLVETLVKRNLIDSGDTRAGSAPDLSFTHPARQGRTRGSLPVHAILLRR